MASQMMAWKLRSPCHQMEQILHVTSYKSLKNESEQLSMLAMARPSCDLHLDTDVPPVLSMHQHKIITPGSSFLK